MANKKVSLVRICKTENGWKRYPAAIGRNGKIRPEYAVVKEGKNLKQVHFPIGRYELRMYEGSKTVYRPVEGDAQDAITALKRRIHVQNVKASAKEAGLQLIVEEDTSRATIQRKKAEYIKRLLSQGKQRASETAALAIDEFVEATDHLYIDEVREDSVLRFYRFLRKKKNADRTIFNKHSSLFSFFRWLKVDVKKLAEHPPSYTKREVEIYDPEDIRDLFAICDEYQRVVFETLLKTGMRMQEAMHLQWTNVDFRKKLIRVREYADEEKETFVSIKDRAERSVPLADDLAELLEDWKKKRPNTCLVLGTKNDTPNWKWLQMLKRLAKRAGLNCDHCAGCRGKAKECGRWKLKTFRSTYTTTMLRAGVDPRTLMSWTGHEDLETILKYLSPAKSADMQQKVSAIQWI